MDEIVTEHAGSILRIQLNRPAKRNAMTSTMYLALADIFDAAANDRRPSRPRYLDSTRNPAAGCRRDRGTLEPGREGG